MDVCVAISAHTTACDRWWCLFVPLLVDILLPVCSAKLNLDKVAICSKAMKSAALEYQEVLFIDQDFFYLKQH